MKLFLLLIPLQLLSQNLVLNPSFELTDNITDSISSFNSNVKNWSTPNDGTTDLFDSYGTDEKIGIPNNYIGYQQSSFGDKYVGCYFYSDDNYREYIQGHFKHPLKRGQKYRVSFYISFGESSKYALKNIGFVLSNPRIMIPNWNELSEKVLKNLWLSNSSKHIIEGEDYFNDSNNWILISKDIIAKGGENFIIIGNYDKNSETKKKRVNKKAPYNTSYYYIDMVSVELADKPIISELKIVQLVKENKIKIPKTNKIELNKKYVFQNITFNFNSIELSHAAKSEINVIYEYLNSNQNTKIIILGYTDNLGSNEYNQTLSDKRAKSVADYFMKLRINKKRIRSFGYGNSQPLSTNKTDEGRMKNRRVEFKITKHNNG